MGCSSSCPSHAFHNYRIGIVEAGHSEPMPTRGGLDDHHLIAAMDPQLSRSDESLPELHVELRADPIKQFVKPDVWPHDLDF